MKSFIQIQAELLEWQTRNFPDRLSWEPVMGAMEELGELAHAHLKEHQKIRNTENHVENARDAVADITIYLLDYCNARGWNFEELVASTWEMVRQRDWNKHRAETLKPD
jgi:NTP pyrophosphatase (non-canonical NTP hydrolase)